MKTLVLLFAFNFFLSLLAAQCEEFAESAYDVYEAVSDVSNSAIDVEFTLDDAFEFEELEELHSALDKPVKFAAEMKEKSAAAQKKIEGAIEQGEKCGCEDGVKYLNKSADELDDALVSLEKILVIIEEAKEEKDVELTLKVLNKAKKVNKKLQDQASKAEGGAENAAVQCD